jgi:hypothetical protein
MSLENLNARSAERHTPESGSLSVDEALLCPTCDQPVSPEKFEQIQVRVEGEERARAAKIERTLQTRFVGEMAKVEAAKKAEVEKARREAAKAAEAQVKAALASHEKIVNQRLQAQRATLEKAKSAAVSAEKEKYFREKVKLEEQLQEMQRRLQKKTPNELGDEAELDLFEELKREFPNDQIERIKKGKEGGDIILRVIHNGQLCGSILLESKNTRRFMTNYTTKLRNDQVKEGCDHAILSTLAFPAGARQIALRNGALICHPGRVVVLVHLLRRQILQAFSSRLNSAARQEKSAALYEFVVSDKAAELWDQFSTLTEGMRELDQTEIERHRRVWAKRADLITSLVGLHDRLSETVTRIIGATESEAPS